MGDVIVQVSGIAQPFEERFLYGEASGGHTYNFFAQGYFPVYRSVRRGRFKLVSDSKSGTHALYDLASDPAEQRDISLLEPDVKAELTREMAERYGDASLPEPQSPVELSPEDAERLRALGYVP